MSAYIEREFKLPEVDYASLLTAEELNEAGEIIPEAVMYRDFFPICWYLRTPLDEEGMVMIAEDGSAEETEVYFDDCESYYDDDEDSLDNKFGTGNRPALYFKTSLLDAGAELGSSIRIGEFRFTVISEKIALCDHYISVDIFDEETNDYEKSAIKKRVDDWFKEYIKPNL